MSPLQLIIRAFKVLKTSLSKNIHEQIYCVQIYVLFSCFVYCLLL